MKYTLAALLFAATLLRVTSSQAQCVLDISCGIDHSVSVKPDGSLWGWGFNGSGQLGDGSFDEKNFPTRIGTQFTWKIVTAGGNHTLAIKKDGTLWAWGDNLWGQIGDGSFGGSRTIPKMVSSATDWKNIYGGRGFSLAIKNDGTLWAWGDNFYGQLGFAATVGVPTKVNADIDWKTIAAGGNHTLAIKNDGSLWAWGSNLDNQLGDGTGVEKKTPTRIGIDTDWIDVSAGYDFSVALKSDGTLWAWGNNDSGQLGNGTTTTLTTPTKIGIATDWKSISTGYNCVQAIKTNGTLWNWGDTNDADVPTQLGIASDWGYSVSGDRHFFAFNTVGEVWTWGDGTWGKLGLGDWSDFVEPHRMSPAAPTVESQQTFCNVAPTVADLRPSGMNVKWYAAASSGLALPTSTLLVNGVKYYASGLQFNCESMERAEVVVVLEEPTPVPTGNTNQTLCPKSLISNIAVIGENITWYESATNTAPLYDGNELINGRNYFATQTVGGCQSPRKEFIITLSTPPAPIGATSQSFCAGTRNTALHATGVNIQWYQPQTYAGPISGVLLLRDGLHYYATQTINGCESATKLDVLVKLTENKTAPPIADDMMVADKLVVLPFLASVIDTQGRLWAWGWNGEGQMADGTRSKKITPVVVNDGPWQSVGGGDTGMFGVKTDGSLWAWGSSADGQLGTGTVTYNYRDILRVGTDNNWKQASLTYHTSAGLKTDGTLWTWGQGGRILGDNNATYPSRNTPTRVGTANNWDRITPGYHYFLGLRTNTFMYGWGLGEFGELGNGSMSDKYVPTYSNTENWKIVSGSYHYSAGVKHDGSLWTWGSNEYNVMGNVGATSTATPTRVGTDTDWKDVSAGFSHVLALKNDGTLWAWGTNNYYQLGDGTTTTRVLPIQIGIDTDWKIVGAGWGTSFGIKNDGSVWSWGENSEGGLGNGLTTNVKTPTLIQGATQYVCTSAAVEDLSVAGSNVQWYSNVSTLTPLPNGTALNDNSTYFATQTIDGCESPKRTIVFVKKKDPSSINPPTGVSSQTFCNGATVASLRATGKNLKWYTSASGGDPISPETPLTNNEHYFVSQSLGSCESSARFEVAVTVDGTTTLVPTGPALQIFCEAAVVADLTASGSSVSWYSAVAGGSPLPVSTALTDGLHYYASQTAGNCESVSRLEVVVKLPSLNPPTGNAVQSVCTGATLADLSILGSDIQWYAGLSDQSPLPSNTILTNETPYYTSQRVDGCESNRLEVMVIVHATMPAPTGPELQTFCEPAVVGDLSVFEPSINWYSNVTGGSPLLVSTTLEDGSHYFASQTSANCESESRLEVIVKLMSVDAPTGSVAQSVCYGATVSDLAVSGTDIRWYAGLTDQNPLPSNATLTDETPYYASQRVDICESNRLEVIVDVRKVEAPLGISAQTFCKGATVSSLEATGTNVQWYLSATGDDVVMLNSVLTNNIPYFASQTIDNCESIDRLSVVTEIIPLPSAPEGPAQQSLVAGTNLADLQLSGSDIKWYASDDDARMHVNALDNTVEALPDESYFATQTVLGCEGPALTVNVSVITSVEPYVSGLRIYPNPVTETLNITMNEVIENVTLSNSIEQRLIHKEVNDRSTTLDLCDLASGSYWVHLKVNGRLINMRIVKE